MAGTITDFYPGTTKKFTVTCKIGGTTQDIRSDTLTFRMKTTQSVVDSGAVLSKTADVATGGASGVGAFELTPADTALSVGKYFCDIVWELAGGDEYVIYDDAVKVLDRTSDV